MLFLGRFIFAILLFQWALEWEHLDSSANGLVFAVSQSKFCSSKMYAFEINIQVLYVTYFFFFQKITRSLLFDAFWKNVRKQKNWCSPC